MNTHRHHRMIRTPVSFAAILLLSGLPAIMDASSEFYLDFETLSDGTTPSVYRQELKDEYADFCLNFRNFDPSDNSRSAEFFRFSGSANTVVWDNHRFVSPPPGPNFNITADFSVPVTRVSADVSIAVGYTITMTALDGSGTVLGSDTSIVSPACCTTLVDTLTLSGVGAIHTVLWETSAPRAAIPVIDNLRYTTLVPCERAAGRIDIDIKPWKDPARPNTFNLRKGGRFWVAILSGNNFDALQVDPESVRFGKGGAPALNYRVRDANRDDFDDLLLRFRNRQAGFECGDTTATLYAQTWSGQAVSGTDSIRTVKCKPVHPAFPAPMIRWVTPVPYEVYQGSDGNLYERYRFEVTNRNEYAPELFAGTTEFGPCGRNPSPSRTWVHIYDGSTGARIYGFCALGTPGGLYKLWFAEPLGHAPPASIYITLVDRATNRIVRSNVLAMP